jgi:hypothetical protein
MGLLFFSFFSKENRSPLELLPSNGYVDDRIRHVSFSRKKLFSFFYGFLIPINIKKNTPIQIQTALRRQKEALPGRTNLLNDLV